jgi:hypothetical protein
MSPRPARRDAVRPGETGQATVLLSLEPQAEVFGVVLEGRFQDVAHSGLEISFTRFGEFPPKTQLGAVCEVCENMTVNAAPLAKFQTPAARPPEGAQDGLSPAAHVGPVE